MRLQGAAGNTQQRVHCEQYYLFSSTTVATFVAVESERNLVVIDVA